MNKYYLLIVFLLVGCANFAKTPQDLAIEDNKKLQQCFSVSEELVYLKAKEYLSRCITDFGNKNKVIHQSEVANRDRKVWFHIVEGDVNKKKNLSVLTGSGYSLHFQLSESQSCKSNLDMHAMNSMWARNFKSVANYIKNGELSCPL